MHGALAYYLRRSCTKSRTCGVINTNVLMSCALDRSPLSSGMHMSERQCSSSFRLPWHMSNVEGDDDDDDDSSFVYSVA